MKTIIADHREPQSIIDHLEALDVKVEVEQLSVGDFIISDKLVVERKSRGDFSQSLFDQRLFDQTKRLGEIYDQVIFILEDIKINFNSYASIFGAMSYLMIKQQIQFIPTTDHESTAYLLDRLSSWIQEEHTDPILARYAPKRLTLEDQQSYLLQGLIGVGDKTAKKLLDEVGSPIEIFQEIVNTELIYTRTGNPKGITGNLADIHGIGFKFIEKNQNLLFNQDEN